MTIGEVKDVENGEVTGLEDLEEPFIRQDNIVSYEYDESKDHKSGPSGSSGIVLLSTFVAVCGSFEFGSCVSVLFSLIMIHLPCL
jgi:SP family sugar porter-like MFS transporter